MGQCIGDMSLPYHTVEGVGPVFAGGNDILTHTLCGRAKVRFSVSIWDDRLAEEAERAKGAEGYRVRDNGAKEQGAEENRKNN